MAEKKWFVPADGSTVFDPATGKKVPVEGMAVEDTVYWRGCVEAADGTYLMGRQAAPPVSMEPPLAKPAGGNDQTRKRS
jgi:hypothetical protein